MKNFKLPAFFFLLCLNSFAYAGRETIHFNILLFGDKIGDMLVTHEERNDGTEFYTLETHARAKILWIDKEDFSRYEVTYKNGKLISSSHNQKENGKVKRWTNVNWDGSLYQVDSYKGKRTFSEPPLYSIVTIYFKDIKDVKRIFYEAEADFNSIEHPEADKWEFKSSDGTRNVYHFANGKIKGMDFHLSIATIKMVRTE